MYWILDNGHSGLVNGVYQTPGKRSPVWPNGTQLFEGVFNREIVKKIAEKLKIFGIEYKILVPEEEDISLYDRVNRVNFIYRRRKDAVLVSVHGNAGGGTGWEVWTSKGETKSDGLASVFYRKACEEFPDMKMRSDNTDGDPDKEAQFYILRKTYCPALLTENFFMDTYNPDCLLMMSNLGKQQIANIHIQAIMHIDNII